MVVTDGRTPRYCPPYSLMKASPETLLYLTKTDLPADRRGRTGAGVRLRGEGQGDGRQWM